MGRQTSQYGAVSCFSSRSRHTRYWRDWSSDVCSSDLLCVTQSAVSQQVRQLEDFLEVRLFRRLPRRVELAREGRSLAGPTRERVRSGKRVGVGGGRSYRNKNKLLVHAA